MDYRQLNHLKTGVLFVAPGQIMDPAIMMLSHHPDHWSRLKADVGLDVLEAELATEIRSIDWLSRSPDTLVRKGRPAPSDQRLTAMKAVVIRFLARLANLRFEVFRRIARRQIQSL